jgi:hypothetical protein
MQELVKCYDCRQLVPKFSLHHRTSWCDCVLLNPDETDCDHGVCDDCYYGDEEPDEEMP